MLLTVSTVMGVIFSVLCLAFCGPMLYMFSTSKEVLKAVDDLSILLDSIQPILSVVAVGAGMQSIMAVVNLASSYAVELPSQFMEYLAPSLEPVDVLTTRRPPTRELKLLVHWLGRSSSEDSWLLLTEFVEHFPTYKLEGKLGFDGRGIDRYHRACYRRNKEAKEKAVAELELAEEQSKEELKE